ncbi:MAG: xylulokinase, partial [Promethearchaeota archaeon]
MDEIKYILAIDHGTSSIKVGLVSTRGDVVGWESEKISIFLDRHGGAEQDPDEWWDALIAASKRLLDRDLVKVDDIIGICNTSQWSGTVALDRDGNHLMNAIIWMDTRGAPYLDKVSRGLISIGGYDPFKIMKWIKITGGGPSKAGKDPPAHILWIREEHPEIYEKTFKFLEPQDYINFRLTGWFGTSSATIQLHWITDINDINNIHYSHELIKQFKFSIDKFPTIMNSIDVLGKISKDVSDLLGLNSDTKVVLGAPDVFSAVIGSGAVDDYQGCLSVGTSDFLLCHVPFQKTSISSNMASLPSAIPGKYLLMNEQNFAGGILNYIRDNLMCNADVIVNREKVQDVFKLFDKIVESANADSIDVIFTPLMMGERAPKADYTLRAGFYNISYDTTRAELLRAMFEGVAFNIRWLHLHVEKFVKRRVDGIHIIGGCANSDVWCQIFADVLGRSLKKVKNPQQANLRGAAMMAAIGLGYSNWNSLSSNVGIEKIYSPDKDRKARYDVFFKEYLRIYKFASKLCRRLNRIGKRANHLERNEKKRVV